MHLFCSSHKQLQMGTFFASVSSQLSYLYQRGALILV